MFSSQLSTYPYNYIYFNEFVDEEKITYECEEINGCGEWETDYWGLSGKSLILNSLDNIDVEKQIFFVNLNKFFLITLKR